MVQVYIALGSNLNTPTEQLNSALEAISALPNTELKSVSGFYQSKPLGPQDQPDYVNAVAMIETTRPPLALLDELQRIENEQGRVRLRRWGERTLDLDILLYGDQIIQNERLTVPHYDMKNREFVIVPLYDIAQDLVLPEGEKVANLVKAFENHQMHKIKNSEKIDRTSLKTKGLIFTISPSFLPIKLDGNGNKDFCADNHTNKTNQHWDRHTFYDFKW